MIFDADTHIMPDKIDMPNQTAEELIDSMDKSNVDKALVWLQPPYLRYVKEANNYIAKSMIRYENRLFGFGWIDPHLGESHMEETIKKGTGEYGFYGFKFNGAQNNYYIDDPILALPAIEKVAKTGKIIAFHCGADEYEYTHPYRVGKIAKMFPETTILMVHMGGASFKDLADSAIEIAQEHKNIYLIGSAVKSVKILKAINTLGANRVCFGSDSPFEYLRVAVSKYESLLTSEITKEEKDLIMGKNIQKLLGVK